MATIYKPRKITGKEIATNLRLCPDAHKKLEDLAAYLRKSRVETVELLICDAAKDLPQLPRVPQLERLTGGKV